MIIESLIKNYPWMPALLIIIAFYLSAHLFREKSEARIRHLEVMRAIRERADRVRNLRARPREVKRIYR